MGNNNYPFAPQLTISDAVNQAYAHWHAGQAPQAEHLCLRVLATSKNQPDALHLLGLMAHAYGQLDLALGYLRKACLSLTAPAGYHSNLAEICRMKGLLPEAEKAARRAVRLDPALVAGWNNLGIILQERGELQASLECLERVTALQPDNAEVHNNLANTYKRMGQVAEAKRHYHRALELHPNYAPAHSNLALVLSDEGRYEEAYAAARLAIDIDPQLIDAYFNLAEIETSRLRHGEALRWLDALLAFAPEHAGGLAARAHILASALSSSVPPVRA